MLYDEYLPRERLATHVAVGKAFRCCLRKEANEDEAGKVGTLLEVYASV